MTFVAFWPAVESLIREGRDIRQDYIAAQRLLAQHELWSPFTDEEIAKIGVDPQSGMPTNFHPPTTLLVFAPFTFLSFRWAVILWSFFSLLFFYSSLYVLIVTNYQIRAVEWLVLSLATVFWFPLWLHVRFGQFSSLVLLFLTIFGLAIRRGNRVFAGIFLAIACLIKIFPVFILLLLVVKRQWRALLTALGIVCLAIAVIYLYHPESIIGFVDIAFENDRIFRSYFGNFSLNGFVGRLFHGTEGIEPLFNASSVEPIIRYSGSLVLILLAIILSYRISDFDLCLSLYTVVMLILSPTTWAHNFVILALPTALLLKHIHASNGFMRRINYILSSSILVLSAVPHWQFYEWLKTYASTQPLSGWFLFTSPGFYVLVGMLLLCLINSRVLEKSLDRSDFHRKMGQ
ncbi:MAG: hypothetical protein DDG58_01205 [Ardenticatenia bacterium]|jgi:alpha-1,2-mannosyltransferase|nr:MAG: hypothetical protein DDG58_01205 [Ardenticatenia bacterium]